MQVLSVRHPSRTILSGGLNRAKSVVFVVAASLAARFGLSAPILRPDATVTRSVSGQFIIHDQRPAGPSGISAQLASDPRFVSFDQTVLAVSCERLKHELWNELSVPAATGRERIHVVLRPAQTADDRIAITSERFHDGWQYIVELPEATDRIRYLRGMVQVLMQELANTSADSRSAEIPVWLVEGLTQHLLASNGSEIIVAPPRRNVNGIILTATNFSARKVEPLDYARAGLRTHEQLTFQDLSWPRENAFAGESAELYRLSALVLINELLRLKDGPARLQQMLTLLPQCYNWQVAFLTAFHDDFPRLLDVEKWWTLRFLRFVALEPAQTWPVDESWRKLEEALQQSIEVRNGTNDLPLHAQTTLQTVVSGWKPAPQTHALESKLRELEAISPQLAPEVARLAEDYRKTLAGYLENAAASRSLLNVRKRATLKHAQVTALERLDQLDSRRDAFRPRAEPVAAARQKQIEPLP